MRSSATKAPFLLLAILVGVAALMLFRTPVSRYNVTCTRAARLTCALEQIRPMSMRKSTTTLHPQTSAVVHVVSSRRGIVRVFLYLQSPGFSTFAAEFEGGDAGEAANAAARQLNAVLAGTTPATVTISAVAPLLYRRLAWSGLAVMGLLTLAGYREASRPTRAA
jgi:hypothetical protein